MGLSTYSGQEGQVLRISLDFLGPARGCKSTLKQALAGTSDAAFAVMRVVRSHCIPVHVTGTLAWAFVGSCLMDSGHTLHHLLGCVATTEPTSAYLSDHIGEKHLRAALVRSLKRLSCVHPPNALLAI